jgi:ribosomal protein S18
MTVSVIRVLMMEAVRTSETSVYFNETTRRYITEGKIITKSEYTNVTNEDQRRSIKDENEER